MPPLDAHLDPRGAITDVAGVYVGHATRRSRGWRSGTTVVHVPGGAVAGVDVRGGGPGTRETDAIRPGNLVESIHAVCLSGGSAYGLAAADGVMAWLAERRLGVPVGPDPSHVVPVVPAAVIFDLGRGGRFEHRPDQAFGRRAIAAARAAAPARGAVGAGTGAVAGGLQGGVGMASAEIEIESTSTATAGTDVDADGAVPTPADVAPASRPVLRIRVGALVVVNSAGSVIDPSTGHPWAATGATRPRPTAVRQRLRAAADPDRGELTNTTIGVIATDARLDRAEAGRLATAGHDGIAHAVRPSHLMVDGDTLFGLATGAVELPAGGAAGLVAGAARVWALDAILGAAARCVAAACADAVVSAASHRDGPPAYRDVVGPDA